MLVKTVTGDEPTEKDRNVLNVFVFEIEIRMQERERR